MASLSRRSSQASSPTRLSPLPEQRPYSPTTTLLTASSLLSSHKSQQQRLSRRPYSTTPQSSTESTLSTSAAVSERSDSGISECSLPYNRKNSSQNDKDLKNSSQIEKDRKHAPLIENNGKNCSEMTGNRKKSDQLEIDLKNGRTETVFLLVKPNFWRRKRTN